MVEHFLFVKDELAPYRPAREGMGEPEFVVHPHLVIGYIVFVKPDGRGLLGFTKLPLVITGDENVDVDRIAIDEIENEAHPVSSGRGG